MLWPFLSIDNFFNDPDEIVEYAKNLEYKQHVYPGGRSDCLSTIDPDFYVWINKKILTLLYPNDKEKLYFKAATHFQKVSPGLEYDGWVHSDKAEFTCIIYLSKQNSCGTSMFVPKQQFYKSNDQEEKHSYFKDPNGYKNLELLKKLKEDNNEKFEESINVNSKYNRMVMFDGSMYHAAQPYLSGEDDRITLISFVYTVQSAHADLNLKYPISEMRRI
jgi:hypothetical protein